MNLEDVLEYCAEHGISLTVDEAGQVKVAGSKQALTPEVVDALRKHRSSITARLQGRDNVPVARAWSADELAPISTMQRQLLALDERFGDSLRNHLIVAYTVEGDYCAKRCRSALDALLEQHVILRSVFVERDGAIWQRAVSADALPVAVAEVSSWEAANEEAAAFASRRFDLSIELPFRLLVHREGSARHRLTWAFHHVAVDGESVARILSQYSGYGTRSDEAVSSVGRLQYRDYAAWEPRLLEMQASAAREYWDALLANARALRLPTGDDADTSDGEFEECTLSAERVRLLGALARQCRVSLHAVVEALFAWNLACHLDDKHVLYGTPVTLRNRPGLQDLVGPLVNTQVRYFELTPEQRFTDFLTRCAETIRAGLRHAEVPQDVIADSTGNGALRVVDAFFTLQAASALPDSRFLGPRSAVTGPRVPPKFAYTLNGLERAGELLLRFEWDSRRVASVFVRDQARRLIDLIDAITARPSITLQESQALLASGAVVRGASTMPQASCFLVMFERSIEAHGNRTALQQGGTAMTYRELDELSARWAAGIRRRLAGATTRTVVVAMPRCPAFFVAQLAIMRANATFVPVDVSLPRDRITTIIERSLAAFVLVLKVDEGVLHHRALDVDLLAEEPGEPAPIPDTEASAPAYLIFTSGTTGRPKGVLVGHAALANLASAQARIFDIEPDDRVLQYSALGFDAQVSEWSTAWIRGAALVLPSAPEQRTDVPALIRCLHESRISHVTLPPAVLSRIDDPDQLPVRVLIAAGEACSQELADRFARARRFINAYGPTEAAVCATTQPHTPGTPISLGLPIDNVVAFVADANHQPLPIGAEGELCIGGAGLAIGYIGDEEQTRIRFPVLAATGAAERYYLTGDRVRRDAEGRFVFVGRMDDEVKIRGNRIAPEEIAHHLATHACIAEACCIFDPKRQILSAAVVLRTPLDPGDIRRYLAERLPSYMVPGRIVVLDALPITTNGKVDKSALATLVESSIRREVDLPDEPLARQLAEIWRELLDAPTIGLDSDFYALGGHSLLAAKLKREVDSRLGLTIEPESVFTHFLFSDFLDHVRGCSLSARDDAELEELDW